MHESQFKKFKNVQIQCGCMQPIEPWLGSFLIRGEEKKILPYIDDDDKKADETKKKVWRLWKIFFCMICNPKEKNELFIHLLHCVHHFLSLRMFIRF